MSRGDLTDTIIRNLMPPEGKKSVKLSDKLNGLSVKADDRGRRFFIMRYTYDGKQREIEVGAYPKITLKRAREIAAEYARALHDDGIDPKTYRDRKAIEREKMKRFTVESYSMEYLTKQREKQHKPKNGRPSTFDKNSKALMHHVFPKVGKRLLGELTGNDWYQVLEAIKTPKGDMRRHVKKVMASVYRAARAEGGVLINPIDDLRGAFKATGESEKKEHMAALVRKNDIAGFLEQLEINKLGRPQPYYAIWMQYYTWLRPTECLTLRWEYLQLDDEHPHIEVPAEVMKMGKKELPHYVPLCRQALALLKEIEEFNESHHLPRNGYLFPSHLSKYGVISDQTICKMIEKCGYKGRQTRHGIRATVSSLMYEKHRDMGESIELQLDHVDRNKSRIAYKRYKDIKERIFLVQSCADTLDELKPKFEE